MSGMARKTATLPRIDGWRAGMGVAIGSPPNTPRRSPHAGRRRAAALVRPCSATCVRQAAARIASRYAPARFCPDARSNRMILSGFHEKATVSSIDSFCEAGVVSRTRVSPAASVTIFSTPWFSTS